MKKFVERYIITASILVASTSTVGRSNARDNACPSADDVPYSTQVGETWYSLGGRAYCLDGPGDRSRAALALHEYNRGRVGPNVGTMPEGITVCLPKFLHGPFFDAVRCRSAPVPTDAPAVSSPAPPVVPAALCGNGVREEGELCDGRDMGSATCATLNLPGNALVCRADCHGFDAKGCMDTPKVEAAPVETRREPEPTKKADEPRKPMRLSIGGDFAGGVMFPLAERQRSSFYSAAGLARLGARFGVGPVELSLHGMFGGSVGTTRFGPVDAEMSIVMAGGEIQAGIPIALGAFQLTPGVEANRVWMRHTAELPPVYEQSPTVDKGGMSFVGAFLRTEYRFQRFPRIAAGIELAGDFIVGRVSDFAVSENFQMKMLGGLSYATF